MMVLNMRSVLLNIALLASIGFGQDEVPSPDTFLRRANSRASVIGDYIYFHGGELSQAGYISDERSRNPVNATLSIDLSKPWSSKDVKIQEIPMPKDMLPMSKQAIFTDESSGRFYVWGGRVSDGFQIGEPVLWYLDADGKGGGDWVQRTANNTNSKTLEQVERVEASAYVSTPKAGFAIGGTSVSTTSLKSKGLVSGYVALDYETKEWTTEVNGPYSVDKKLLGGVATFVPNFGDNGLVMILGGKSGSKTSAEKFVDFETLHFFDPVTRNWFSQKTSGEAPSSRAYHCATGAQSKNGTFEIFVFGGWQEERGVYLGDMYVLSLPGFHWTRVSGDSNDYARSDHVCTTVGTHQLLVWGGTFTNDPKGSGWETKDPFPQGIGLFDMGKWEWTDKYDASGEQYESHSTLQSWYNNGGLASVEWSSPDVQKLFVTSKPATNEDSKDNTGNQMAGGDSNESNDKKSSKTPVGTIVGAVVGGVAAILIAGLAYWFFARRRQRHEPSELVGSEAGVIDETQPKQQVSYRASELPFEPKTPASELSSPGRPTELSVDSQRRSDIPELG